MKKIFFLIPLSLLLQWSFAQTSKHYLVKFKDKNNSEYSVDQPSAYLSEKSISRRQKQNIKIIANDLPVNSIYINAVKSTGVSVINQSRWLNAVTISTADETQLEAVRSLASVKEIILTSDDASVKVNSTKFYPEANSQSALTSDPGRISVVLNYGPSFFQANQIGADCMHNSGYMGQGMTIAVLDAGFYKADSLPAFDSLRINNQLLGCRDFVTGDTLVFEDFPHGMNVLSCMVGNLPGQLVGTAPKAKFWLLRTEDAFTETLQEEVNWLVAAEFADSVGADIINTSLGYTKFDGGIGDHFYSDMDGNTTIVTNAADWAASKGIFVTCSAGNAGGPPWYKISAPADADSVLTVGAVDSAGVIAGFSSRGLTFDGRVKPNVCARGVQATIAGNSGGTSLANGTSFSSPITAGAVACLWQSNPTANILQLISAIQQSASQAFLPDSIQGYGIPDFCTADSILGFMVTINDLSADEALLSVYPNPFHSDFVIDFFSNKKEIVHLELYDISGRKILTESQSVVANNNRLHLSQPEALSKGIYTLRVVTSGKTYFKKIVKQ
jgi:hypothetical protein